DPDLVNELFPYQRQIGANFMALRGRGEYAEPWTRAAARTQVAWAQAKRGPLLALDPMMMKTGRATLGALGISPDRWYAGLHVRASSFYGESKSGISDHRNSRLSDYLPAVRDIVDRGGIVVRLGDGTMEPMPKMDGVIDYAHSEWKSPAMDLFL